MSQEEVINLQDIIGSTGRYQILATFVTFYTGAIAGILGVFIEFMAPEVELYWGPTDLPNKTTFMSTDCKMEDVLRARISTFGNNSNSSVLYYQSRYSKNTLTQKFNLVCEDSWLISFANSLLIIGSLFGSIVFGRLSEIFGRKTCTQNLLIAAFIANVCLLFPLNFTMFAVSCFAFGAASIQTYLIYLIQTLEIIPDHLRPYYGTIGKYGQLLGQILVAAVAWALQDWFYIQIFQTAFIVTCIPLSWLILESPIYLIVRGNPEMAKRNLITMAKRNGLNGEELERKISLWIEQNNNSIENKKNEDGKVSDLFQNKTIGTYTGFLTFILSSILFMYYALLMNVESFGSGLFLDLTISNVISIATVVLTVCILTRLSIKTVVFGCLLANGIVCALYAALYEFGVAREVITSVARIFVVPCACLFYVYLVEIFPTSVRVVGTGFVQMGARALTSASPFTKELGEETAVYVPFILFSALSFVSAILLKTLPETRNKPLVQTVEDLNRK